MNPEGVSKSRPIVVTAITKPGGWDVSVQLGDRRAKPKLIGRYESVEETANVMVAQWWQRSRD